MYFVYGTEQAKHYLLVQFHKHWSSPAHGESRAVTVSIVLIRARISFPVSSLRSVQNAAHHLTVALHSHDHIQFKIKYFMQNTYLQRRLHKQHENSNWGQFLQRLNFVPSLATLPGLILWYCSCTTPRPWSLGKFLSQLSEVGGFVVLTAGW